MTSNLEQKFYDTFGIEPKCHNPIVYLSGNKKCKGVCQNCKLYNYPNITEGKLLEMICVLNEHYCNNHQCAVMIVGDTTEKIKECVLKDCIEQSQHIKSKIKQLFKEKE